MNWRKARVAMGVASTVLAGILLEQARQDSPSPSESAALLAQLQLPPFKRIATSSDLLYEAPGGVYIHLIAMDDGRHVIGALSGSLPSRTISGAKTLICKATGRKSVQQLLHEFHDVRDKVRKEQLLLTAWKDEEGVFHIGKLDDWVCIAETQ